MFEVKESGNIGLKSRYGLRIRLRTSNGFTQIIFTPKLPIQKSFLQIVIKIGFIHLVRNDPIVKDINGDRLCFFASLPHLPKISEYPCL